MDHRDLALEQLAHDEVELRERISSLEQDVVAYRLLAQRAIHSLREMTLERDRIRSQHHRLLDARRRLRAQVREVA